MKVRAREQKREKQRKQNAIKEKEKKKHALNRVQKNSFSLKMHTKCKYHGRGRYRQRKCKISPNKDYAKLVQPVRIRKIFEDTKDLVLKALNDPLKTTKFELEYLKVTIQGAGYKQKGPGLEV